MRESKLYFLFDRYLGQVLCFFSIFWVSVLRLYIKTQKKNETTGRKILIVELFEMGSAMMAYPALVESSKTIKAKNIYCLCTSSTAASWELLKIIPKENIIAIPSKTMFSFILGIPKTIWNLHKLSFDTVIDLSPLTRISSLIISFIAHKELAGFCNERGEGYFRGFHYNQLVPYSQNLHSLYNFLILFRIALKLDPSKEISLKKEYYFEEVSTPYYHSQEKLKEKVLSKLKEKGISENQNLFLLGPDVGKNLSQRNYPQESYIKLIPKIHAQYPHLNLAIILIGTKENFTYCEEIKKNTNENVLNFCGLTETLEELLELFHLSSFYLGNDNGLQHFASMTDIPFISIFGPESPKIYGPLGNGLALFQNYACSPCISFLNHKSINCSNNLCVQNLSVEKVLTTIDLILKGEGKARTVNNRESYLNEHEVKIIRSSLSYAIVPEPLNYQAQAPSLF